MCWKYSRQFYFSFLLIFLLHVILVSLRQIHLFPSILLFHEEQVVLRNFIGFDQQVINRISSKERCEEHLSVDSCNGNSVIEENT